ncbi:MAG TPA: hypothetical protein VNT26_07355, partial [Candidatus Sulfotelmatobacter sp.]|nr:hypothetical protein [Candidatus Sulfotelmatobacter sp.]
MEQTMEASGTPNLPALIQYQNLGPVLRAEFDEVARLRQPFEEKWVRNLRQYRGQYDPEILRKIGKKRSKAFVRLTKSKCRAVLARLMDLLFPANGEKNWGIQATPDPTADPTFFKAVTDYLVSQGANITEEMADRAVAAEIKKRAQGMEKVMTDQLTESPGRQGYREVYRSVLRDGLRYGTGILKGPLYRETVKKQWTLLQGPTPQDAIFDLREVPGKPIPDYSNVPIWNFYPDTTAITIDQARFCWESHLMTKAEVQALAKRRDFFGPLVAGYLRSVPEGDAQLTNAEIQLRTMSEDMGNQARSLKYRYRVLERWGKLTGQQLRD